jgi:hypothetical protein
MSLQAAEIAINRKNGLQPRAFRLSFPNASRPTGNPDLLRHRCHP